MTTPWVQWIEKRNKNIGFASKVGAFKPPTPAEKAAALSIETVAWQLSQGKRTFTASEEYRIPVGHGINLLRTREPGGRLDGPEYKSALESYVTTPMDHHDILKAQGIDVTRYEILPNIFQKLVYKMIDWFMHFQNDEYESPDRTRLTPEFIETFSLKEKK